VLRSSRDAAADPDDDAAAEAAALRILAGAGQSAAGLQRRLRNKGFAASAVEVALERCRARGYIDDGALAASVAARLQRSGHGSVRVAAELRARGVEHDAAAAALEGIGEGDDDRALEVGRRLVQKEIRRGDEDGMRRRIAGALQRRGFSGGTIAGTLRRLSAEAAAAKDSPSSLP
jgi:regulatory protein